METDSKSCSTWAYRQISYLYQMLNKLNVKLKSLPQMQNTIPSQA